MPPAMNVAVPLAAKLGKQDPPLNMVATVPSAGMKSNPPLVIVAEMLGKGPVSSKSTTTAAAGSAVKTQQPKNTTTRPSLFIALLLSGRDQPNLACSRRGNNRAGVQGLGRFVALARDRPAISLIWRGFVKCAPQRKRKRQRHGPPGFCKERQREERGPRLRTSLARRAWVALDPTVKIPDGSPWWPAPTQAPGHAAARPSPPPSRSSVVGSGAGSTERSARGPSTPPSASVPDRRRRGAVV